MPRRQSRTKRPPAPTSESLGRRGIYGHQLAVLRRMRERRRGEPRAELVARLERVRGQMTDVEFENLVRSVERAAARFTEIDSGLRLPRVDNTEREG